MSLDLFQSDRRAAGADGSPQPEPFFRLYKLVERATRGRRTSSTAASSTIARSAMRSARSSGSRPSPRSTGGCSTSSRTRRSRPGGADGRSPSPIPTILGSDLGHPTQEPILDEILEVSRHNERVRRVRDIIEMTFDTDRAARRGDRGGELGRLARDRRPTRSAHWRDLINEEAKAAAGLAYATYLRSKVSGVVDRYARTICRLSDYPDDCNQAAFVRAVLRSWAEERLFTEREGQLVADDDQSSSCGSSTSTTARGGSAS